MPPAALRLLGLLPPLALAAACGGGAPAPARVAVASPATGSAACSPTSAPTLRPLGDGRTGSAIALAEAGGRTIAFIADEDEHAIVAVDVDRRLRLAVTPLAGAPSQLVVLRDGRIAVALRDRASVAILEPAGNADQPLSPRCAVETAAEPVGLAVSPDDATLVVTSGWGQALAAHDARTMARLFRVDLEREPRAVIVSDDGSAAFVSHAVGSRMSVVALRGEHAVTKVRLLSRQPTFGMPALEAMVARAEISEERQPGQRMSCQGYALARSVDPPGRILAPQVMVEPGQPERRPGGYGDDSNATEVAHVAVIDEAARAPMPASLQLVEDFTWGGERTQDRSRRPACLLPRAAAVDPASRTLLVTCLGIDAVVAYDVVAATPVRVEKKRWIVSSGPTGIAVDAAKRRAVVWSQFDRSVDVVSLADMAPVDGDAENAAPTARIAVGPSSKVARDIALGRRLFHAVGDTRISFDGRACASCHPDGRDDALTWATPTGPRRTASLAGRIAGTAPYDWNGAGRDLEDHLEHTFDRLNGQGLRSVELASLVAYLRSLQPPASPRSGDQAKVARGAEIFRSKEAACSSCHAGASLTDGKKHDVASTAPADGATEFDTPSLRFVAQRAPYFHDGRYPTLRALLQKGGDKMGRTKHLSSDDLAALEAYLRSL
jgi:DNA-binding beta-propeller fold protein YncE